MSYQYIKNSRHNLKRRLLYIMGSKCQICGYDKCQSALEFHHIDSQEKDFSLGANANIAFSKAKEEVKKCILVCANCHREIHEGLHDNLQSSYDEAKAQEIERELEQLKTKKIHYCPLCNAIISSKATYCKACSDLVRRKADRPTRQELKDKIRTQPFTTIAAEYGVTDNAVRKWCKQKNLPSTKKEINAYSNQEWEKI